MARWSVSAQAKFDWAAHFQRAGHDAAVSSEPDYAELALAWISVLRPGHDFTWDDVTDSLGPAPNRGVSGAVTRTAKDAGLIVGRGYDRSRRISNRRRVLVKWRRT